MDCDPLAPLKTVFPPLAGSRPQRDMERKVGRTQEGMDWVQDRAAGHTVPQSHHNRHMVENRMIGSQECLKRHKCIAFPRT